MKTGLCFSRWMALLPPALLAGCVGAATEGANVARDRVVIENNLEAARAGDAEAQYRVGDAYCCSLHEGRGFYDTPQSVEWLCLAARQDHPEAALRLGEIYSGDVVSGVRILRRVGQRIAGTSTNVPVAYAWLRRAEALGMTEAGEPARDLWTSLSANQRSEATAMVEGRSELPCEWDEVIRG